MQSPFLFCSIKTCKPRIVRNLFCLLVGLAAISATSPAQTCTASDQYGGLLCMSSPNSAGFFRLGKVGSRSVLVTPESHAMFMLSVYSIGPMDGGQPYSTALATKYGKSFQAVMAQQAARRLKTWGFNSIGEYSSAYTLPVLMHGHSNPEKMPFLRMVNFSGTAIRDGIVKNLFAGLDPEAYKGWRGKLADVFDPAWVPWTLSRAQQSAAMGAPLTSPDALPNTPWMIGISTDDGDNVYGIRRAENTNAAWAVAATAPRQGAGGKPDNPTEYSDTTLYTKLALMKMLQSKYSTLAALNAAWGSTYTTWGSSGTGSFTNRPAAHGKNLTTLAFGLPSVPIAPGTVTISAPGADGSTITARDDGKGNLTGSGVAPKSTIHYATGYVVLNTTVPVAAPADSRKNVFASYTGDSWPKHLTGGTGFMDEDGSSLWLKPTSHDYSNLSGLSATVVADLNAFVAGSNDSALANRYFATVTTAVRSAFPNQMVFSPMPLNVDLVQRPAIVKAASMYYDALQVSVQPSGANSVDLLSAFYDVAKKPLYVAVMVTAQADSPQAAYPRVALNDFPTQAARGVAYASLLNKIVTSRGSDGTYFAFGLDYWEWTDKTTGGEHGNFGLVTNLDNAYDGGEDVIPPGVDPWGYPTGGEAANYGSFLGAVSKANQLAVQQIQH